MASFLDQILAGINKVAPDIPFAGEWYKSGQKLAETLSPITGPIIDEFGGFSAAPTGRGPGGAAEQQFAELGGASGMFGFNGTGTFPDLTLNGGRRRGLIPYSGGVIPRGYRVGNRPPRAPTAGTAGGTYLIPIRHMNPLNPRALLRAERRMSAFTHWVKRHFRIAAATPRRRKIGTKKRRR